MDVLLWHLSLAGGLQARKIDLTMRNAVITERGHVSCNCRTWLSESSVKPNVEIWDPLNYADRPFMHCDLDQIM